MMIESRPSLVVQILIFGTLVSTVISFQVSSAARFSRQSFIIRKFYKTELHASVVSDQGKTIFNAEDDDDNDSFKRIVGNYLMSKFKECQGEECRMFVDRNEVGGLLKAILPPVNDNELKEVIDSIMTNVGGGDLIDADAFLEAAMFNKYWLSAGSLVVKELIFLDCLYDYYYAKKNPSTLSDDDYSELKEMLTVSYFAPYLLFIRLYLNYLFLHYYLSK